MTEEHEAPKSAESSADRPDPGEAQPGCGKRLLRFLTLLPLASLWLGSPSILLRGILEQDGEVAGIGVVLLVLAAVGSIGWKLAFGSLSGGLEEFIARRGLGSALGDDGDSDGDAANRTTSTAVTFAGCGCLALVAVAIAIGVASESYVSPADQRVVQEVVAEFEAARRERARLLRECRGYDCFVLGNQATNGWLGIGGGSEARGFYEKACEADVEEACEKLVTLPPPSR